MAGLNGRDLNTKRAESVKKQFCKLFFSEQVRKRVLKAEAFRSQSSQDAESGCVPPSPPRRSGLRCNQKGRKLATFFQTLRRCSSFAKSHACCGYAFVNAGITPPLRYQLFAICACGAMHLNRSAVSLLLRRVGTSGKSLVPIFL